jgi:signal transduction histidine kinase
VSSVVRALVLLGPVTIAMVLSAMVARALVRHTRLVYSMMAIAAIASLVTIVDLLALNHFMLIEAGDWTPFVLIALYSLGAGIVAAMIVARTTTNAIGQLVTAAQNLGHDELDTRVGDVRASPELQLLAHTLDAAAERLARALESERRVDAERRDLTTSISHDLRTPLANLRAMVEAIKDGVVDDPDTVRRYSDEMLISIMRLVEMVDDLFELARIDAARFIDDAHQIPLSEVVQRAIDLSDHAATSRDITVIADLGDASAGLCSLRLSRVVHTLVDNAVRYTPDGGRVSIRAHAAADGLHVAVEDNGLGIDNDQLPRVFEPFWRADPARAAGGSGLGLALAQRIVQALGGRIEASSSPGVGSRFDIVVPPQT